LKRRKKEEGGGVGCKSNFLLPQFTKNGDEEMTGRGKTIKLGPGLAPLDE